MDFRCAPEAHSKRRQLQEEGEEELQLAESVTPRSCQSLL